MKVYSYPIVFFDLDETLINKDATSLWIRWRSRRDFWALVEAGLAFFSLYRAYKTGRVTHKRLSRYYRTRTRGMTKSDYEQQVQQFFQERGQLHIYPQAASLLFAYRQQGSRIVMITGTDEVVARRYAEMFDIDDVICNRLVEEDGVITGLARPMCYGSGKVQLARGYLRKHQLSFDQAVFYSDSNADLPMLEEVAQPVVLNPNQALTEIAHQRQWPMLDWRDH